MAAARRAAQNASGNEARNAQRQPAAAPFPAGRRVPKGTLRWYPVRVPEGREAAAAERLRKLASAGALDDAVVVSRERWFKRAGAWSVQTQPLYRGYVFAVSRDAAALGRELDRLGLHGGARQEGGRPVPLADDVRQWIAASMDGAGVLRASEGVIEGGSLRVTKGPLAAKRRAWPRSTGIAACARCAWAAKAGATWWSAWRSTCRRKASGRVAAGG